MKSPRLFILGIALPMLALYSQTSDRMTSSNYQIDRGVFAASAGSGAGATTFLLTDQLGGSHLDRMESDRFAIGTSVQMMVLESDPLPIEYSLEPNFPNPFNGETLFRFNLPQPGQVRLTVFSALGRQLATLVEENRPAGRYEIHFSATDETGAAFASGVYFLRLQTKEFDKTIKFTILK
ncbi:MAG: T9SS C-terminal target domain-containing protein [Calditrichaeota bacterium]|nr:MAG: T9SS C-terminal target domain-containing protein [Calditrichota bacterium]